VIYYQESVKWLSLPTDYDGPKTASFVSGVVLFLLRWVIYTSQLSRFTSTTIIIEDRYDSEITQVSQFAGKHQVEKHLPHRRIPYNAPPPHQTHGVHQIGYSRESFGGIFVLLCITRYPLTDMANGLNFRDTLSLPL